MNATIDKSTERLATIRTPRNGSPGYIVNFFEGQRHIAWHHSHSRNVVVIGKLVWNWVSHGNIPAENSILLRKVKETQTFKEGAD